MTDKLFRIYKMLPACITGLLFLVSSTASGQQNFTCSPTESSAKRCTVFISDLHMGVGKVPETKKWNAMEDFRWEKEFGLFLDEINRKGGGKTDLVINGDLLELWQFVKDNCDYGDPDLGCTEKDALKRVQDVIESHGPEIQMLKKFADSPGENRVYIVPGNHDAALLYNTVAQELLRKINATPGKVCILSNGYWRSSDGLIYAEHGHQIEEGDPNTYKKKWPKPFIEKEGRTHLIRTWGERFVQKYYNPIEKEYAIIDNLSEEKLGFTYGVAARGFLLPADIAKLSKFVFLQVSEDQFIASIYGIYLNPGEKTGASNWNIGEIKNSNDERFISDLSTIIEKLPLKSGINRIALKRTAEEGMLGLKPSDLSDDEIIALCNLRAALIENMTREKQTVSIVNCPTTEPGKLRIQKYIWGEDAVFRTHLQTFLQEKHKELPSIGGNKPKFDVFIYGHTHGAHDGDKYKIELPGYWVPKVFNTGAWIRVINPEQLKNLIVSKKLDDSEVLPKLNPEDLPPCYSFVTIKPYKEDPIAELNYWSLDSNGAWRISNACGADK